MISFKLKWNFKPYLINNRSRLRKMFNPWPLSDLRISFFCFSVENKQRGRFAGFSLYVSNNDILNTEDIHNTTQCYKDGPDLPPLNFTTACTGYGRYVIFYNERLPGVTYPPGYESGNVIIELCEVIVLGKIAC